MRLVITDTYILTTHAHETMSKHNELPPYDDVEMVVDNTSNGSCMENEHENIVGAVNEIRTDKPKIDLRKLATLLTTITHLVVVGVVVSSMISMSSGYDVFCHRSPAGSV